MKEERFLRTAAGVLSAVLICGIIPLILISFFAHAYGDDYSYSVYVHDALSSGGSVAGAVIYTIRRYFFGWQGTFSATVLMSFSPNIISESSYFITSFVMLGSLCFSTAKLTHTLICRCLGKGRALWIIFSSALLIAAIQFVPSPIQSFFWWNGSVYYTFFYSVMLLWIDRLIAVYRTDRTHPAVCAVLLSVVLGGGNYVTALLSSILGVCFCALCFWGRRRKLKSLLTLSALLLSFAVSALAPGNAVRQASASGMDPFAAIFKSISYACIDCVQMLNIPILLLFLSLAPFIWLCVRGVEFRFPFPAAFTLLTFLIFAAQNTPHFFAMSSPGPERLRNIVFFSYLWLLLLNESYWIGWICRRFALPKVHPAVLAVPALSFILAFLLYTPSTAAGTAAAQLLDGYAAAFDAQMDLRVEQYKSSDDPLVCSTVTARPSLLYMYDLTNDPDHWVNRAVANYYHKTEIIAED